MVRSYLVAAVTIVAVVVLQLACDRVPLTSPTGSTISITSDRDVLPLNGQATLRAVVIESAGTPVQNGTVVNFTTTLGNVNPPEATTINGVATALFNAGSISGTSVIQAFSGGAKTGSGNSSGGVSIAIGAKAAKTISLSATPSSVSQSGGTATIAALVLDDSSNPLPGVNVTFSADTGQVAPVVALSDATGVAKTQLTTTQTAKVTATAGTATNSVTVTVSAAPTVTIDAPSPASPFAGQPVTFTVSTSSGNSSAPRQVQTLEVNFGDGQVETRSNVTGATAFTHTYNREGGYTITARAVDVSGNTGLASRGIIVGFAPQPSVAVTLSDSTPQVNQIIGFTITGTPGPNGGAPIESVRAFIDGQLAFSGSGSSGAFSKGFSSTGTYLLEVQATDRNGNVAKSQQFITVTP